MRIIIRIKTLFLASLGGNYRCCLPIFGLFKQLYPDLVCSRTDICIEGYPRSGNTYFVEAFEHWNPRSKVAHHSHHACNVKRAIKDGLPAVIRLRKPESAAASVIVWDGLLLHGVPLMAYAAFYSTLWRYRENLPVLNFDYAVNHPEVCINRRFGTGFSAPKISEDDDHAIRQYCMSLMRATNAGR